MYEALLILAHCLYISSTVCAVCLWSGGKSYWKAVQSILLGCTRQHECRSAECTNCFIWKMAAPVFSSIVQNHCICILLNTFPPSLCAFPLSTFISYSIWSSPYHPKFPYDWIIQVCFSWLPNWFQFRFFSFMWVNPPIPLIMTSFLYPSVHSSLSLTTCHCILSDNSWSFLHVWEIF